MTDDIRLKRLSYRAHHRGFKEADLLLGTFADAHLGELSPGELGAFEELLEEQDQDIYDWYLGKAPVPPQHDTPLFARLKAFEFFPRAQWT
jgi:antitoxin CptB